MFIYILLAILLAVYAIIYDKLDSRSKSVSLYALSIFLMLFSAFRGFNVDHDSSIYDRDLRFSQPIQLFLTNPKAYIASSPPPEMSFCLLASTLLNYVHKPLRIILFIYAMFAIPKKIFSLKELAATQTFGFVLLAYFSNFFLLHDMTQIRVGLAIVFFFIAIPYAYERKFVPFVLLILAGTLIHRSLFATIIVYFLNPKEINFKLWISVLLFFLFLGLINYDLLSIMTKINIPVFSEKINVYLKMQQWIDVVSNPFNTFLMLQLFTSIITYTFRNKIAPKCKYFYLLLKINLLSIIVFYIFIAISGFSFRLNELFGVVQILMLPMFIYVFKQRWIGQLFVISVSICMLLFNLYHTNLMQPYYLCFFD